MKKHGAIFFKTRYSTGSTWYCTAKIDVVPDCYWIFVVGTSNKPETTDLTMIFSRGVLLLLFSCSAAKVVFPLLLRLTGWFFFFFSCCRVNDDDSVVRSHRLIVFLFFPPESMTTEVLWSRRHHVVSKCRCVLWSMTQVLCSQWSFRASQVDFFLFFSESRMTKEVLRSHPESSSSCQSPNAGACFGWLRSQRSICASQVDCFLFFSQESRTGQQQSCSRVIRGCRPHAGLRMQVRALDDNACAPELTVLPHLTGWLFFLFFSKVKDRTMTEVLQSHPELLPSCRSPNAGACFGQWCRCSGVDGPSAPHRLIVFSFSPESMTPEVLWSHPPELSSSSCQYPNAARCVGRRQVDCFFW